MTTDAGERGLEWQTDGTRSRLDVRPAGLPEEAEEPEVEEPGEPEEPEGPDMDSMDRMDSSRDGEND